MTTTTIIIMCARWAGAKGSAPLVQSLVRKVHISLQTHVIDLGWGLPVTGSTLRCADVEA